MSCEKDKHDWRAVIPFVHPTEKNGKGEPLEIRGGAPRSTEEPAWCRTCGAMWDKMPLFGGWGVMHHHSDSGAPTLANMLADSPGAKRVRAYLAMATAVASARAYTPMSQEAEAEIAALQAELVREIPPLMRDMVDMRVKSIQAAWGSH